MVNEKAVVFLYARVSLLTCEATICSLTVRCSEKPLTRLVSRSRTELYPNIFCEKGSTADFPKTLFAVCSLTRGAVRKKEHSRLLHPASKEVGPRYSPPSSRRFAPVVQVVARPSLRVEVSEASKLQEPAPNAMVGYFRTTSSSYFGEF